MSVGFICVCVGSLLMCWLCCCLRVGVCCLGLSLFVLVYMFCVIGSMLVSLLVACVLLFGVPCLGFAR